MEFLRSDYVKVYLSMESLNFNLLCYKSARSRLVGRPLSTKILIILFYIINKPCLKINGGNGTVAYVKPLNKRADQKKYDEFYIKNITEKIHPIDFFIDIKYSFDLHIIQNIFFVCTATVKGEGDFFERALCKLFNNKCYSSKEIQVFLLTKDIYLFNEATFEFQLLIWQLKQNSTKRNFICLQHATYPEYHSENLNEAQVAYYLSAADNYLLWDDFTVRQYKKSGTKGSFHIMGRPNGNRFIKYQKKLGASKKYLLFLSGTHALNQNKAAIDFIYKRGFLANFYFALHPNDSGSTYRKDISITQVKDSLNEYSVIISFSSTIIVDLIVSEAPLLTINSKRYQEYGSYINCKSIQEVLNIIQKNKLIPYSVPNKKLCINNWKT